MSRQLTVVIVEDEPYIAERYKEILLELDEESKLISNILIFNEAESFNAYHQSSDPNKVFIVDLILDKQLELGERMGRSVLENILSRGRNPILIRSAMLPNRTFNEIFADKYNNISKWDKSPNRKKDLSGMYDTIRQYHKELQDRENEVNKYTRLCLRVIDGEIRVFIVDHQGRVISSDGTELIHQLYVISRNKWARVLAELEKIINKKTLQEQELQTFLEAYPELILQDEYEKLIPQATIVNSDGIEWKADFVLVPGDQLAFCKILELKLPAEKVSRQINSGHHNYSSKLFKAINQLKDYHEAFNSEKTTEKFKSQYNVDLFKPDLQLFIGRRNGINTPASFLELQRRNNIKIKDWDSVLQELRKKFL